VTWEAFQQIKERYPLQKPKSYVPYVLNKAIDEVRAGEHRQMQKEGYEPVLKSSRWCLLKRWENLTEKQEVKLNDLLQYNLTSVRAYLLKEDLNGFWEYVSPAWAEKFLDRWSTRVMRSRMVVVGVSWAIENC
jgi:transposase